MKENIHKEKNRMEKETTNKVKLILKLKKEMGKEKNMIFLIDYYLKENI
jgi:uncharacterized Fe-S cluster-containing protein